MLRYSDINISSYLCNLELFIYITRKSDAMAKNRIFNIGCKMTWLNFRYSTILLNRNYYDSFRSMWELELFMIFNSSSFSNNLVIIKKNRYKNLFFIEKIWVLNCSQFGVSRKKTSILNLTFIVHTYSKGRVLVFMISYLVRFSTY